MISTLPASLARWAAGVILVAGIGAWAGWSVRDGAALRSEARLRSELVTVVEQASADTTRMRRVIADLEGALERQNAEVRRLGAAYDGAVRRSADAERRMRAILARPTPAPVVLTGQCEDMVEQVRRAALR